jgi:hypothetical protein
MNWIKRAILTTLCCAAASAGPITFTETQNGIGSLGGKAFSAPVTIVLTSDTSTITGGSGVFFDIGPATVTVAGLGTATFTDTMEAVVSQGCPCAGISDETTDRSVMFDTNSAFSTYGLSTAIGPLLGESSGNSGLGFSTSMGAFILSSSLNNEEHPATFTATTVGSVPEPGTLGLLAAGIALFLIRRRVAG